MDCTQARCTWIEIGMMIISVVLFEKYCDVRNSEIVMMILIICVVYLKIRNKLGAKKGKGYIPSLLLKILCLVAPYGLAGFMILVSRFRMDGKIKYSFFNETFFRKRSF